MLSKGNRSFASKTGTMLIREPETIRLGRDTEKLVEYMEHEKRESVYLDQQISLLQEELNQLKATKKSIFPSVSNDDQQRNKCVVLEKKIELEITHLNETKTQSQALRNEVNSYRKDKSHYKRTLQNIKEDINKCGSAAEAKKQEYLNGIELENKYKKKIQNLRSKSMLDRSQYTEKVSEYSLFIKEKIETRKQIHKQIEDGILGQIKRHTDTVEISKLQKKLVERWEEKLLNKKKALDNYMKHLNVLQETFEQIKAATGIHSVSEIVTAVIKSEEQNYEVYSYVNSLNTEIDGLREKYARTLEDIKTLETTPRVNRNENSEIITEVRKNKEKEQERYEKLFNKVQDLLPFLKSILKSCLNSPIPLEKPKKNFEDLDTIEYEEVSELLGTIEDYIGYAHMFLSNFESKNEEKRREKTPVNIKDLEIKDFVADHDLDDLRMPLSVTEFQQRSLSILKDSKPA